ncbi:hypothetical protein BgiMline_009162 [Biomphalaria glabrata]|nr:hypothetical protein BgiBS90_014278 [Biomphalaria glabrata]
MIRNAIQKIILGFSSYFVIEEKGNFSSCCKYICHIHAWGSCVCWRYTCHIHAAYMHGEVVSSGDIPATYMHGEVVSAGDIPATYMHGEVVYLHGEKRSHLNLAMRF